MDGRESIQSKERVWATRPPHQLANANRVPVRLRANTLPSPCPPCSLSITTLESPCPFPVFIIVPPSPVHEAIAIAIDLTQALPTHPCAS